MRLGRSRRCRSRLQAYLGHLTMGRFVAWMWDPTRDAASRVAEQGALAMSARGWTTATALPGFHVMREHRAQDATHVFGEGSGVMIGTVFRTRDSTPLTDAVLEGLSADRIRRTSADVLAREFWGRYTCIVFDSATLTLLACRDPSGGIPCFHTVHRDVQVLCSRPIDLAYLGIPAFEIHSDYLATHLARQGGQSRTTALHAVLEIQPGDVWTIASKGNSYGTYWSAAQWAANSAAGKGPTDPHHNERLLRDTVVRCVSAWRKVHPKAIHTLSGGIDSSIVAAAWGRSHASNGITCVNYVTADAEGDERNYAAAVSQHCGHELREIRHLSNIVSYERLRALIPASRPTRYRYSLEHGRQEAELAKSLGASAILDGGGGDQLFFQAPVMLAVSDALRALGTNRAFWQFAAAVAHEQGRSWAGLLALAIRGAIVRYDRHVRSASAPYLNLLADHVRVGNHTDRYQSPVIEASVGLPPGKRLQIASLSVPHPYFDAVGELGDPVRVSPLISQPIMELCLQLPTWQLCEGGIGRGLARRAFASDLPMIVLERRGKGRMAAHIERTVRANVSFVREFLLEGLMVREGWLDRERLEQALSLRPDIPNATYKELEEHLSTEAWLRAIKAARELSRSSAIRLSTSVAAAVVHLAPDAASANERTDPLSPDPDPQNPAAKS